MHKASIRIARHTLRSGPGSGRQLRPPRPHHIDQHPAPPDRHPLLPDPRIGLVDAETTTDYTFGIHGNAQFVTEIRSRPSGQTNRITCYLCTKLNDDRLKCMMVVGCFFRRFAQAALFGFAVVVVYGSCFEVVAFGRAVS